jgi:hypothetical protein
MNDERIMTGRHLFISTSSNTIPAFLPPNYRERGERERGGEEERGREGERRREGERGRGRERGREGERRREEGEEERRERNKILET